MSSKKIRLIFNEAEDQVVVQGSSPVVLKDHQLQDSPSVVLDAYHGEDVSLTFYWRGKTPYTVSLPLVSEQIKKVVYPGSTRGRSK